MEHTVKVNTCTSILLEIWEHKTMTTKGFSPEMAAVDEIKDSQSSVGAIAAVVAVLSALVVIAAIVVVVVILVRRLRVIDIYKQRVFRQGISKLIL